jgi:hypothetical protein
MLHRLYIKLFSILEKNDESMELIARVKADDAKIQTSLKSFDLQLRHVFRLTDPLPRFDIESKPISKKIRRDDVGNALLSSLLLYSTIVNSDVGF